MNILDAWHHQVRANPQRIILADTHDQRAIDAAQHLNAEGLTETLIAGRDFGSVAEIGNQLADEYVDRLEATNDPHSTKPPLDVADPLVMSAVLVRAGWAAGCIGGASRPTADVVRVALRVLGVRAETKLLSSCFLFVLPDGRPIAYGDCAVVPDPSERQLAAIAVSTAETFAQLTSEEPRVAMLSFSTRGSAQHRRVNKVRDATTLVKKQAPQLKVDGELQFDTAWVPEVAATKAVESEVAGNANVFIFPDLDAGNIAYKITERLGKARAFGPLFQGLNAVMHDLSRGCSSEDIVNVAVLGALQAAAMRSTAFKVGSLSR